MREALIICPKNDNSGNPLPHVKRYAVSVLSETFGGCTVREAHGAWVNPDTGELMEEPVWELTVAAQRFGGHSAALREIAIEVGYRAGQHSVYLRHPSGEVEIIAIETVKVPEVAAA